MIRLGAYDRPDPTGDYFRFLQQFGVRDVVLSYVSHPDWARRFAPEQADSPDAHWDFHTLLHARQRCEDAGMNVLGIENPLPGHCYVKIMLGQPGRDQQIENIITTIRNMGRAGIRVYGYNWMVNQPGMTRFSWRTSLTTPARGGARASAFDYAVASRSPLFRDREYSADEMWANYAYFIKAVLPVAAEVGVRLAVHPDDPPIASLGGVARLFHSFDSHKKALDMADNSPASGATARPLPISKPPVSGLNFCLGNWTAMGTDVVAAIRHFAPRGQIVYGHIQGVQGTVPSFRESFLDDADADFLTIFRALAESGFDIVLCPGHNPHTVYDTERGDIGMAHAFGFVQGLLKALG